MKKINVCIAGGGKVGFYLAKSLLAHQHKVSMIDPDEAACRYVSNALDLPVVCGDAIRADAQDAAGCRECGVFVAVTGSDSDNLIACQVAKAEFGVQKTVARVSNPQNRALFHQMGVDVVVCGTDNLAHLLEREIETDSMRQLLSVAGGSAALTEITLPENFCYAGKQLSAIPVPSDAILVSITRGEELVIPRGSTKLLPGDRVMALAKDDALRQIAEDWKLAN
jgi:trk system potassium uptake protein TrkA